MQCLKFSIVLSGLFCLSAVAPASAQDHAQHEHESAVAASAPTPAQGWPTDVPLRAGMANIRTSVEAMRHLERGNISRQQVLAIEVGFARRRGGNDGKVSRAAQVHPRLRFGY